MYRLALAFVTSYIFYFLVVHVKSQVDKSKVYPYVASITEEIILSSLSQMLHMRSSISPSQDMTYPSEDEVTFVCSNIHPYAMAPMRFTTGENANWMQFFDANTKGIKDRVESIYKLSPFLDSEYVGLISLLSFSNFMRITPIAAGIQMSNPNILFLEKDLIEYYRIIAELEAFCIKKYKIYGFKEYELIL
jgi:hypothetical protein